ncbi:hypothetical protein [Candidatus Villigracilis proximus]|uniref:hypothetical protein n=1 Tax=Candidatus Villigracilis proximus TaxID=3140683 RepID=UPI0031EA1EF1
MKAMGVPVSEVEERDDSLMRGQIFVKDADEFDRHEFVWHISRHADQNAFGRDGLIARWNIELVCA